MLGFGGKYYWGRREREEKVKGLVVIYAWMSSEQKHVKSYVDLFGSLGWNSLVCHSQFLNMYVFLIHIPSTFFLYLSICIVVYLLVVDSCFCLHFAIYAVGFVQFYMFLVHWLLCVESGPYRWLLQNTLIALISCGKK